jgi:CDGSH-type Zn-finger protein
MMVMEDATKTWPYLRPGVGRKPESKTKDAPGHRLDTAQDPVRSVGQKTLDKWFLDARGGNSVQARIDVPNEALVTSGGPIRMTGNITLVDESGAVTHANQLDFCRCGKAGSRPLCDRSHLDIEFIDRGAISRASDCLPLTRPQNVTVTCVKDGPLRFRGYLRLYNRKGQECSTMQGALCRCGRSTNKPFCDCE